MALDQGSFTSGQTSFIQRLASDTGLDAGVIAAWCYAEENGSAAQSREAAHNHNWLNIGYFDSGAGAIAFSSAFGDPSSAADQTARFLQGTWGGASGGIRGILLTVGKPASQQIATIQSSGWATSGYPNLPSIYGELSASFKTALGAGTAGGSAFGAGGTGTPGNQPAASLWQVGDASNPDQDYWTTVNQYSMDAQWYSFSDGETLVVADGIQLMAQRPQAVIVRTDPRVVHAECTYDNNAFHYTSTHKKRGKIQRRTSLAKVTSPTEVQIRVICNIDQFRAGETVWLKMFGPADGTWLIGNCVRDVFLPYSELTLVQAMQPINAVTGAPTGPAFVTGKTASQPGAGTVIAAMISEAATVNNDNYSYVWGGGHARAGTPDTGQPGGNGFDGHTKGFDCSGAVAAVLAAGGLVQWGASVPGDSGLVQQLLSENKIMPGQGTGSPECSIFDYPGQHIFMRLNGQYFGTESGDLSGPSTALPDNGSGVGWMKHGSPGSAVPYHVPASILGQVAGGTGSITPSATTPNG